MSNGLLSRAFVMVNKTLEEDNLVDVDDILPFAKNSADIHAAVSGLRILDMVLEGGGARPNYFSIWVKKSHYCIVPTAADRTEIHHTIGNSEISMAVISTDVEKQMALATSVTVTINKTAETRLCMSPLA
jgi:hypothetical protein